MLQQLAWAILFKSRLGKSTWQHEERSVGSMASTAVLHCTGDTLPAAHSQPRTAGSYPCALKQC